MFYVSQPPLITLAADLQTSAKYSKDIPGMIQLFEVLKVGDDVLAFDENEVENTIIIDRATTVGLQQRWRLLKIKKHRRHTAKLQKKA